MFPSEERRLGGLLKGTNKSIGTDGEEEARDDEQGPGGVEIQDRESVIIGLEDIDINLNERDDSHEHGDEGAPDKPPEEKKDELSHRDREIERREE
jgi:hypothetical protein